MGELAAQCRPPAVEELPALRIMLADGTASIRTAGQYVGRAITFAQACLWVHGWPPATVPELARTPKIRAAGPGGGFCALVPPA